jgi:hypothetical protein
VTVSDLFDVPTKPKSAPKVEPEGGGTSARDARATVPATQSDSKIVSRAGRIKAAVSADFRNSWVWDEHGPTIRTLINDLMPAADRVPAGHGGMRWAWVVYSFAALAVLTPLLFVCWVLCHPARLLYTAPIAALVLALWING